MKNSNIFFVFLLLFAPLFLKGGSTVDVTINDVQITEGDSGSKNMVFTLSTSGNPAKSGGLSWNTVDGTATAGDDYTAASGTITGITTSTSPTITIQIIGDTIVEPNETFTVKLHTPTGKVKIDDDEGIGTIENDDTTSNTPPIAQDDTASTPEDTPVTINVLNNDNDADGDTLSITVTSNGPSNGSATINTDKTITYSPNANWNGTDTFDYTIIDGNGGSDTATVTVTVTAVNDAPTADDKSATTNEDTAVMIIEHDLIILDYVTDFVHLIYGKESAYGIVSKIKATKKRANSA